jgi:hypothetical protein
VFTTVWILHTNICVDLCRDLVLVERMQCNVSGDKAVLMYAQVSQCETCGRQSSINAVFSPVLRFSTANTIPPMNYTHFHLHVSLARTSRRNLRPSKKLYCTVNRGVCNRKVQSSPVIKTSV